MPGMWALAYRIHPSTDIAYDTTQPGVHFHRFHFNCRSMMLRLPDEVVWTLLLQQWDPLEQAVLCKLMCCSQAMADLVHQHCAGMTA